MDEEKFLKLCRQHETIYVYGAGRNAVRLLEYLLDNDINVNAFLVSNTSQNPIRVFGIPVKAASEHRQNDNELIICSIVFKFNNSPADTYISIVNNIVGYGWHNVFFFSNQLFMPIYSWVQDKRKLVAKPSCEILDNGDYFIDANASVEAWHNVLVEKSTGFRCRIEEKSSDAVLKNTANVFCKETALDEFTKNYGKYNHFKDEAISADSPDLRVYMAQSHVDRHIDSSAQNASYVIPLQVGAALTKKVICSLRDNQGDNISARNAVYSEGTALYWMWKNAPPCDYIGLCHYRRRLDLPNEKLQRLSNVDVLVTIPTFSPNGLQDIFGRYIPQADIELLLSSIKNNAPAYFDCAERFSSSRFYPPCNLFVMKKRIFDEYAEFLFAMTFAIEKVYEERNIFRFDRYMGYLIEWLLGIFLMRHKDSFRIAYYESVRNIDDMQIETPDDIKYSGCDYIVVAIWQEDAAREIMQSLFKCGFGEKQVVWTQHT